MLTFKMFQQKNKERCEAAFYLVKSKTPSQWITRIGEEYGEICKDVITLENLIEHIKGYSLKYFSPVDYKINLDEQQKYAKLIAYEIADCITYLALLASRLDIDLEKALIEKFNIVSDRKNCEIKLKEESDGTT